MSIIPRLMMIFKTNRNEHNNWIPLHLLCILSCAVVFAFFHFCFVFVSLWDGVWLGCPVWLPNSGLKEWSYLNLLNYRHTPPCPHSVSGFITIQNLWLPTCSHLLPFQAFYTTHPDIFSLTTWIWENCIKNHCLWSVFGLLSSLLQSKSCSLSLCCTSTALYFFLNSLLLYAY